MIKVRFILKWILFFFLFFSDDILRCLQDRELGTAHPYLENQSNITPWMHTILMDWMVEVGKDYKLLEESVYLGASLVDRYLSIYGEREAGWAAVAGRTACLLVHIASKYEELCHPSVVDFCDITDNTYTPDELKAMEVKVLTILDYELTVPTITSFLPCFLASAGAEPTTGSFAQYVAELTLLEYSFHKYCPSVQWLLHQLSCWRRWPYMGSNGPLPWPVWRPTQPQTFGLAWRNCMTCMWGHHGLQSRPAEANTCRQRTMKQQGSLPPQQPSIHF